MRYGDEIGMGDDLRLRERDCARTPMQWSTEAQAGFSRADKLALPVIHEGAYGYERINAADQRRDHALAAELDRAHDSHAQRDPEFGWGDFRALETGHHGVLALRYNWRNNDVLAVHNFCDETVEITLQLAGDAGRHS